MKQIEEAVKGNKFNSVVVATMSFLFLADLLFLSVFGKRYTETLFFHPIYVHDFLLLIIFLLSFFLKIKGNRILSIEILIGLSLFYLGYSLVFNLNFEDVSELLILLRQFMVFGYLILLYPIIRTFNTYYSINQIAKAILIIGLVGVTLQFFYSGFLSISHQTLPFFKKFYFTPVCFFSIIITASYVLVHIRGIKKFLFFSLCILLSFTVGHDSLYLSLILLYAAYLFLKFNRKQKMLVVFGILVFCLILFLTIPQFSNWTSLWRLYYWQSTLKEIVFNNYFIFGKGFGIPYISEINASEIYNMTLANGVNYRFDRWVTPSHNSFLTLCYHVGVMAIILLFVPLKDIQKILKKESCLFILLCLIGFSFFSFFNVILELPHLTTIYWLVYFTLVFQLKLSISKERISQ